MNKSLVLKKKIYLFSFLVFSFILFLYLLYTLVNAQRGIIAYYKISNENIIYNNQLNLLNNINKKLEDKISRLSPQSLDLDYLEEQIRFKVGTSDKNELIIILDQ